MCLVESHKLMEEKKHNVKQHTMITAQRLPLNKHLGIFLKVLSIYKTSLCSQNGVDKDTSDDVKIFKIGRAEKRLKIQLSGMHLCPPA